MAVWLVRAGRRGERQDFALDNGCVVIGWDEMPDLRQFPTREALRDELVKHKPNANPRLISAHVGQLWNFSRGIKVGDLVALPLKGQSAVALGKFTSDYEYKRDNPGGALHVRKVEWIREDIPRDRFPQDILNSLGSLLTVSQIRAADAEVRMKAIAGNKAPPLPIEPVGGDEGDDEIQPAVNLETIAHDEIRTFLSQKFAGHDLADLVDAVLKSQGYQTQVSTPGPDGGVDIIAGRGPMGFDPPRLIVQVKATKGPQDVKTLRELKGIMRDFGAEQGLFVSWGGFTREAVKELHKSYFEIRLWDAGELVSAILRHYEQFSESLRAELPLKRIWTLVHEED